MQIDSYNLIAGINLNKFEFWSEGKKERILKVILFEPTLLFDTYNLAFGDINTTTGTLNDLAVTNNGDTEKVLATVVKTIYIFTDNRPDIWIYATGSTSSRTRLYQMGINKYIIAASEDFYILGKYLNEWEWYEKGGNYQAFAVRRKNS